MKALTIWQPWAWAIIEAGKTIENRTWTTSYRGPLIIHAGKCRQDFETDADWIMDEAAIVTPPISEMVFGAIVGVVKLVDCCNYEVFLSQLRAGTIDGKAAKWAVGPCCWRLEQPRALQTPIPYRGRQGLWDITDPAIIQQIEKGQYV